MVDLTGRTNLGQTAGLVQRAGLYVSADTGVLHIAYGVGTPTVHMFGSGIQEKWAPRGRRYVVINKGLPCSPCTRYGYTPPCPYRAACMDAITVDDVVCGIEEVLGR
jgi:ADP-heptose:LPS heptosyltransferase